MSWTPDKYEYASTIQGCDMSVLKTKYKVRWKDYSEQDDVDGGRVVLILFRLWKETTQNRG